MQAPPTSQFGANFSEIQSNVFTPTCAVSGCHQGAGAPQGLRLDEVNSFGLLVSTASSEDPAVLRVAPGDPDNSYLINKLEGTASVGAQMPLGGAPLEQATIDIIRQWIIDGAIDDRTPSADPIRVTSLSPLPASDAPAPAEIIAMFDRELDVSTVNSMTVLLQGSGGDGTFGDGNEVSIVPAGITAPTTTPMSLTVDLTGVAIPDDTYQFSLLGSGPSIILDIDANALDGEFSGSFPSGDGTQGGDFEATFTVTTPPPVVTFSDIQANVFTPTCAVSGCHTGLTPPQGLRLDDGFSFANLESVASMEVPTLFRVAPGDPDASYLVQKLEGTASVGAQMPLGGPPLSQNLIDDIRQWITDGAIDDRIPSADPIRVTSLSPLPASDAPAPAEIIAMFDRELDVSTVNSMTVLLQGSGGDGTFGDGNEVDIVAAAITAPTTMPMSLTVDLTGVAMPDDTYQFRLLGSGPSIILEIDANALDGEFSGSFPSGDGTEGGDFEATFTVTTPPPIVTLSDIQANVFTPTCAVAGCHTGLTPPQGLRLDDGFSFANLVNLASAEVPTLFRVAPGDPDASYLVQKLEGTAAVGMQMPFGGPPLSQDLIDDIRQWINDGANP